MVGIGLVSRLSTFDQAVPVCKLGSASNGRSRCCICIELGLSLSEYLLDSETIISLVRVVARRKAVQIWIRQFFFHLHVIHVSILDLVTEFVENLHRFRVQFCNPNLLLVFL